MNLCWITISRSLICSLIMGGCVSKLPVSDQFRQLQWQQHQQRLAKLSEWELSGRISFRLNDDAWTASLIWTQNQHNFNIRVIAPLGQGSFEFSGSGEFAELRTDKNEVWYSDNADELLRQHFNWDIPVTGLLFWIKGLPQPGIISDTLHYDNSGRVTNLMQAGWLVEYDDYIAEQGYEIPSRLTIQRDKVRLRLIINDWNITS